MTIGEKIIQIRKAAGLSQEQFGELFHVSRQSVSKWENNNTLPDIMMLCALADYFEVTTDELLGRKYKQGKAVIAAENKELGEKVKALAAQFGIETVKIYDNTQGAVAAVAADEQITHLLMAFYGSDYPYMNIQADSTALHLSPELHFDLNTKGLYPSPDAQLGQESRELKLYISIRKTDQEILSELRNALRDKL